MNTTTPTCPCGNAECHVPDLTRALIEYEIAGGDLEHARLLWCTTPGCRAFEIVDDLAHRLSHAVAHCPDHAEDCQR